jgi:hypothetical protein
MAPDSHNSAMDLDYNPDLCIENRRNLVITFIPRLLPRKGIAHAPVEDGTIDPRTQDTLLQAIAR